MENYTLCLSGGGFRASLFHAGLIRRLIFLDLFKSIERINSISGGSIIAGLVMKELTKRPFRDVTDYDQRVVVPLIKFIQQSPRDNIYKMWPFNKNPYKFSDYVDKELFIGMSFCELIRRPVWTCYATSLNSAQAWKFSQTEIGDSSTGFSETNHNDKIANGVVASACFPPLFRPYEFETRGRSFVFKYVNGQLLNTPNPSPPDKIFLTDGGVYDNLGSESVITKKTPFIVSDASGVAEHWRQGHPGKFLMVKRPIDIAMDQNGKLRRRLLFQSLDENSVFVEATKTLATYTTKEVQGKVSPTPPENMPSYPSIHRDLEKVIGSLRTDLNAFHDYEILALLWNGMVKIDAALKRWCPQLIKEELWDNIPVLNIDDNVTEIIRLLDLGSSTKIWGKQHKELNGKVNLIDNLSTLL